MEAGLRLWRDDSVESDDLQCLDEQFRLSSRHVNRSVADQKAATTFDWQPFRGPFVRWPRATDIVLALFAFAMTLAMWTVYVRHHPDIRTTNLVLIGAVVLFALGSGALLWRRSEPLLAHGVVLATSAMAMTLVYADGPIVALVVSLYSLGRYASIDRWSYFGLGAAIALVGIEELYNSEPTTGSGVVLLLTFVVWYVGTRIRLRGEYLRSLQERALHLEKEQAAEADKAVAEERRRIARELHDIVAHQVSLMTVQAGAAKTVAAKDSLAATEAMASVEKAGRQALDELRHLLGVLRTERDVNELGPQPGLANIHGLVDELRKAGLEVVLTIDADVTKLPARLDLSIYRIVQEALTNVLKHAGTQVQAEVTISTNNQGVEITVRDDGRGATRLSDPGHGIVGMRERAQLLGGRFEARSLPSGGFQIVAHLPTSGESV